MILTSVPVYLIFIKWKNKPKFFTNAVGMYCSFSYIFFIFLLLQILVSYILFLFAEVLASLVFFLAYNFILFYFEGKVTQLLQKATLSVAAPTSKVNF